MHRRFRLSFADRAGHGTGGGYLYLEDECNTGVNPAIALMSLAILGTATFTIVSYVNQNAGGRKRKRSFDDGLAAAGFDFASSRSLTVETVVVSNKAHSDKASRSNRVARDMTLKLNRMVSDRNSRFELYPLPFCRKKIFIYLCRNRSQLGRGPSRSMWNTHITAHTGISDRSCTVANRDTINAYKRRGASL